MKKLLSLVLAFVMILSLSVIGAEAKIGGKTTVSATSALIFREDADLNGVDLSGNITVNANVNLTLTDVTLKSGAYLINYGTITADGLIVEEGAHLTCIENGKIIVKERLSFAGDPANYTLPDGSLDISAVPADDVKVTEAVKAKAEAAVDTASKEKVAEAKEPDASTPVTDLTAAKEQALADINTQYESVKAKLTDEDALESLEALVETAKTSVNSAADEAAITAAVDKFKTDSNALAGGTPVGQQVTYTITFTGAKAGDTFADTTVTVNAGTAPDVLKGEVDKAVKAALGEKADGYDYVQGDPDADNKITVTLTAKAASEYTVTIDPTSPKVGDTLTATVADKDGKAVTEGLSYAWTVPEGATASTTAKQEAKVAGDYKVVVTKTDDSSAVGEASVKVTTGEGYTVTWTAPEGATVTVTAATAGAVTSGDTLVAKDEEVTVAVTGEGYTFTVTAKDANNADVTVTAGKFTMPEGNVTLTITAKEVGNVDVTTMNGETPKGGTLEIQAAKITTRGALALVGTYTAPEWAYDGATISLTVDMLEDGEPYLSDIPLVGNADSSAKDWTKTKDNSILGESGSVNISTTVNGLDSDKTEGHKYTFVVNEETVGKVKVQYLDGDNNNAVLEPGKSYIVEKGNTTTTTAVDTKNGGAVKFVLGTIASPAQVVKTIKYTVSGLKSNNVTTAAKASSADDGKDCQAVTVVDSNSGETLVPAGDGYVTVTIYGLNSLAANEKFKIEAGKDDADSASLDNLVSPSGVTPFEIFTKVSSLEGYDDKLSITVSKENSIAPGESIVVTVALDQTKVGGKFNLGYTFDLTVGATTETVTVDTTNKEYKFEATINSNVTIGASSFKNFTAISPLEVLSATVGSDGRSITIKFSEDVSDKTTFGEDQKDGVKLHADGTQTLGTPMTISGDTMTITLAASAGRAFDDGDFVELKSNIASAASKDNKLNATYLGISKTGSTYSVSVKEADDMASISVEALPNTSYTAGQSFDGTGLEIKVITFGSTGSDDVTYTWGTGWNDAKGGTSRYEIETTYQGKVTAVGELTAGSSTVTFTVTDTKSGESKSTTIPVIAR